MKKIIMIIAVGAISLMNAHAQDAISRFFDKYAEDESFTNVTITSRMFSLFTNVEMDTKEDQEVLDAISKLKGLKILAKDQTREGKRLYQEALKKLPVKEFDELMSVRDEDTDMKFLIKEKEGKVSELIMVMGGEDEFFILTLFGEIDLKQIAKISKAMDIDGLEGLDHLNRKSGN